MKQLEKVLDENDDQGKGIGLSPEGLEEWKQITKNITLRDDKGKVMKIKGSGNFWEDISPATTYVRPVGDALLNKTVQK